MNIIRWKIRLKIFKNPIILKQLGLGLGIPFGILVIFLIIFSGKNVYTLYALWLIAATIFLTWLFISLVYRGGYEVEFTLDDRGVHYKTQEREAKKNLVINGLTLLMGLLSSNPTVAGAGLLAQSRQDLFISWSKVSRVSYRPRSFTILLRASIFENLAIFCTEENYDRVRELVRLRTAHLEE